MGANIPTGNDEEYTEIVAENMVKGKEPTYLELNGIEISEYPSAGISVGKTTIFNKDRETFLGSMLWDASSFDIIIEFGEIVDISFKRQVTMFINGDAYAEESYGVIINEMGNILYTMQCLVKQKLKVLFCGVGDGRLLYAFHRFGCICCGQETDPTLLKNAREMLNGEGNPWNFS